MIYALLQTLSLAGGHIILKYNFNHYHPLHALVGMYICALILLVALLLAIPSFRKDAIALKNYWKVLLPFLALNFINASSFYIALYIIGLSGISILGNVTPVLMICSGYIFFHEKLSRAQIMLTVITIASALLFSFSDTVIKGDYLGIFIYFIANVTWVMMNIMAKRFPKEVSGVGLTIIRIPFLTAAFSLTLCLMSHFNLAPPMSWNFSTQDIIILFILAFFVPLLPYFLFPIALRRTELTVMGLIKAIQPIIGFCAGILFFAEPLDNIKLISAAIAIFAGILYSGHSYYYKKKKTVILPR